MSCTAGRIACLQNVVCSVPFPSVSIALTCLGLNQVANTIASKEIRSRSILELIHDAYPIAFISIRPDISPEILSFNALT